MKRYTLILLLGISGLSSHAQVAMTVKLDEGKDSISRHIYGHFAEHLGRCIYTGSHDR